MDSVAISLSTTTPGLLKHLGLVIPKSVKTVETGWTWDHVFREKYGITFNENVVGFIRLSKVNHKAPLNMLKDKVSKFVRQFKQRSYAIGRVYSVRLIISKEIQHHIKPGSQRQEISELNNEHHALEPTSQALEPPSVVEMECQIDEEGVKSATKKEEALIDDDKVDGDLNTFLQEQDSQDDHYPSPPVSTEIMFTNPFLLPSPKVEYTKNINQRPDDAVSAYAETVDRSAYFAVNPFKNECPPYAGPTPYLKRLERRRKLACSKTKVQDDNESVLTTATQDAIVDFDDVERINRFRTKMRDWPDSIVLKMYDELSKLSEGTWQRWLERAPNTTGVLRQSFRIA